jgi:nicotinamide riboside transporter PnuC
MTALALLGWIGAVIAGIVLTLFFGGIIVQALRKTPAPRGEGSAL